MPPPPGGGWYFSGQDQPGTGGTLVRTEPAVMNQTVILDPALHVDIDAGIVFYDMYAIASIRYDMLNGWHKVRYTVSCLNNTGTVLETKSLWMTVDFGDGFFPMHYNMTTMPVGTTKMNVEVGFSTIETYTCLCEIDDMRVRIYRDKR